MSHSEAGVPFDTVARRLSAERSLAKRRATIKSLPSIWFLDNIHRVITSSDKLLRQELVRISAKRPEHLPVVVEALRHRLTAPVASAAVATALSDSIVSILTVPRLLKLLKQRLSVVEVARFVGAACLLTVSHSLVPHPKLKVLLTREPALGEIAFEDRSVSVEARRLLLKLAPRRDQYLGLLADGIRRGDETMLGLVAGPDLPLEVTEAASFAPRAARAIVSAGSVRLDRRAEWLAAISSSSRVAVDRSSLLTLGDELYAAAYSKLDKLRVARSLLDALKPGDDTAHGPGLQEIGQGLARFGRLTPAELVSVRASQRTEAESVAWLLRVVTLVRDSTDLSGDETRLLARSVFLATLDCPDVFAFISRQLARGVRLSGWLEAVLDEAEKLVRGEIPSREVALTFGAVVREGDDRLIRERLLRLFVNSRLETRDFWAAALDASGMARAWHVIVSPHVAAMDADTSEKRSEDVRQGFAQGYARARVIVQEKLKVLTRAAATLTEELRRPDSTPVLRSVLNDVLTVLDALEIRSVGDIGTKTQFDPVAHEDATGTLGPGEPAIVTAVGFVVEPPDGGQEFLRRIGVRPWLAGEAR